ncbi:MAG: S1 RNA-binding domain-containing protein, partial [Gemmatimonadetes bacterium]|nr:S1 RNA-binding domain-containing protein [Gemmatimonadota bacterium]
CSLTNFGAFVEIEDNIDGLVHISDMSWTKRIRQASEMFKKGDVIPVVVTEIDIKRRRISLSHKDAFENPWPRFAEQYAVGVEVQGAISRILERGVVVSLVDEVDGFVPLSHLAIDELQNPRQSFVEGQELPLEVIEFDKNQKKIVLSVREYFKDKDQAEYEAYLAEHPVQEVVADEADADKDDEMESWGDAHDEQDVEQDAHDDEQDES